MGSSNISPAKFEIRRGKGGRGYSGEPWPGDAKGFPTFDNTWFADALFGVPVAYAHMYKPGIERRFTSCSKDLSRVMAETNGFLEEMGVDAHATYVANLVIEELGTNILKYGYDDSRTHEIRLQLDLQPGKLSLLMEDDGHRFNPLEAPGPNLRLPIEQRAPGGLGLHLVRRMVDRIEYRRRNGWNQVRVEIRSGTNLGAAHG